MVKVFLTESALSDLRKLPRVISKRIFRKLEDFQDDYFSYKSVKKLAGQPFYRIRVGDYRIIFEVGKKEEEIYVLKISHRKNIYK
jgi:mRNA interferase RelE/StbE